MKKRRIREQFMRGDEWGPALTERNAFIGLQQPDKQIGRNNLHFSKRKKEN